MPASACLACAIESPCIDPEQSITIASSSARGCRRPGNSGWKLAIARRSIAVRAADREAVRRLRGLHGQDEVSIHHRLRLRERDHGLLGGRGQRHRDGRDTRTGPRAGCRRLRPAGRIGFPPPETTRASGAARAATPHTRRDRRRQRHPQRVAHPAVHDRVDERDHGRLLGQEVPDVHRVQPGLDRFEHHGRVAGREGVFVSLLGGLLLDDDAVEGAAADLDAQIEQDGVERERKGVDRLDVHVLVVAVGLADGHLAEEVAQGCRHGHVGQGDALAADAGQGGC